MEVVLLALAVLFPEYAAYLTGAFLFLSVLKRYRSEQRKEEADREYLSLLFSLGSGATEEEVMDAMKGLKFLSRFSKRPLKLPEFGWRSRIAVPAIESYLETGNKEILTKALRQISKQEEVYSEINSLLSYQRYTFLASFAASAAVMGIASSVSGTDYLIYVVVQSLISALWVSSTGIGLYESLLLSVPAGVFSYLAALKFA